MTQAKDPKGSGIDDWKSLCNVPSAGCRLHLHIFPMDWASMIGKVCAMCRLPAAHCTFLFVSYAFDE
jgi:hypothetical protein